MLSQVADLLASDVRDFVAETGSWREFIGCLAAYDDGEAADAKISIQSRLIEKIDTAFESVAIVPVAGSPEPVRAHDALLPYYSSEQVSLAKTLCRLIADRKVHLPGNSKRRLVESSLVTKTHIQTLGRLGADQISSVQVPFVLAQLPADQTKIKLSRKGELATDPVLEVLLATWKTIHADDERAKGFQRACQREALFPVGTSKGHGEVRRVAKDDDVFFFPPDEELPDIDLSGIRFLTRALYRPPNSVSSQEQGDLVADIKPGLETIWDVREFQFEEVLRAAVRPKLSGTHKERREELHSVDVLRLLARLAQNSIGDRQLPYTERKKRPTRFALTQLPLPTRSGEWKPAYTLYFGDDWSLDNRAVDEGSGPAAKSVELLLERADVEADFLAPPTEFNTTTFKAADAKIVCENLARAYSGETPREIAADLSRIRPKYRFISKLLPTSSGRNASQKLNKVPVLCRTYDGSLEFVAADEAVFVRSADVRERLPIRGAPVFVLQSNEAINFAAHFGLHDLEEDCLEATPSAERDLPEATCALETRLREVAPYILCRLEADRRTQEMRSRDADNLRNFIEAVTVVDGLTVSYRLQEDSPLVFEVGDESPRGFFLDRPEKRSRLRTPYITYLAPEDGGIDEFVAGALCEFLDVSHFDGILALLSAPTPADRQSRLRLAGAPWEDVELDSKRRELLGETSPSFSIEEATISPEMTQWATNVDSEPAASAPAERKQSQREYALLAPEALIFEDEQILQTQRASQTNASRSSHTSSQPSGSSSRRAGWVGPPQDYAHAVDHVGMSLAFRYECRRLRRDYYFLYVVGGLRRDTNTQPYLREIRKPIRGPATA